MLLNFNILSLARNLTDTWRSLSKPRKAQRRRSRVASVEVLETRDMLTAFTVTTLADSVNPGDGVTSLREALTAANANAGGDSIQFAPNLNGTISLALGELVISDPVTITGNSPANTIIDAHGASRVFNLSSTAGDVTFDSLTITGGRTTGDGGENAGGAIRSDSEGTLSILNSQITGNGTTGNGSFGNGASGGAIAIFPPTTLNIVNSAISGNSTTGVFAGGGAIYGFNGGTLTITDSSINDNSTGGSDAKGGAIYWYAGEITLSNSHVSYNSTQGVNAQGGGILSNKAPVTLTNQSVLSSNSTAGANAGGGALHSEAANVSIVDSFVSYSSTSGSNSPGGGINSPNNAVTVTRSAIYNNTTSGVSSGGGAIDTLFGNITLFNSTISGNAVTGNNSQGGGVHSSSGAVAIRSSAIYGNSTGGSNGWGGGVRAEFGSLTVTNSTISGNSATSAGGGLSVNSAPMTITNSTIVFNTNTGSNFNGGGIFAFVGNVTLNNTIVALNTNAGAPDVSPGSGTLDVNFSLIGNNLGTPLAPAAAPDADGNLIGASAAPINPVLGPLQYNGGFTNTHALLASPAINRGNNALASAAGLAAVDQAGQPRIDGPAIDMGAFESQTPSASFSVVESSVNEVGDPVVQITVNLSAPSALPVFVPFTVGGTANNPMDYTIAASPLLIPAGQTSGTIQVNIVDVIGFEPSETVILTFGTLVNATPGAITSTTLTILDFDDPPTASLSSATQSVSEGVGIVAVTVDLSFAVSQNITIPFTVTGTAGAPADYTISASPLVIPAGSTSGTINLTVVNDTSIESDETVIITLGEPTNATLGATTVETITITDNDFAPVATFSLASQTVNENVGTTTLTVNLSGPAASNVTIPFTLSGTAVAADYSASVSPLVIAAGATTGSITLNIVDDGLIEGNETVIVTLGTPTNATLGATTAQTVTIADNDNNAAPTIPAGQSFSIAENSGVGTLVGTVTANDADTVGPFNTLTFSLTNNPNNAFAINPANGQLTVATPSALNFEQSGSFNVGVTVTDGGNLSATQTVVVNVTNVNEGPSIVSNQSFSVAENSGNGSVVGTVAASDPDTAPPFGAKTFALTSNPNSAFAINATTGQITVANSAALNFETTTQFLVGVSVTDGGSPALSASQNVTINVNDVNESPTLAAGQTFNVTENPAQGVTVGTVVGTDPDNAVPNNVKTFSITGGNTGNAFAINPNTGAITVSTPAAINFESNTAFDLAITLTDGGGLSVTQNVVVNVQNVNEPPTLGSPGASPTFIFKSKTPVVVFPSITVADPDGSADLASVSINVTLPTSKKKLDVINSAALSTLGVVSGSFASGNVTIQLSNGITAAQVESVLRSLTFSSKGASLKTPTRTFQVSVTDKAGGVSNLISQTVNVRKK